MKKISESTSISIGLGLSVLAATAWLVTDHNTGVANAAAIKEIQISRANAKDEYNKTLRMISEKLASIETKLEIVLKHKTGG